MPAPKTLIFFALGNGLMNELSGGTIMAHETIRQLSQSWRLTLVVTAGGRAAFEDYFAEDPEVLKSVRLICFKASFFLKREPFRLFRAWSYLITTCHALLWALATRQRFDIAYPTSDFFFDVIPTYLLKTMGKAKKLIGES